MFRTASRIVTHIQRTSVRPFVSQTPVSLARSLHTTPALLHNAAKSNSDAPIVNVVFRDTDNEEVAVQAHVGDNILDLAHENDIELEGACEGSLACSTCHVILPEEYYDKLEEPTDEEYDMLDMAFGLTETSRLGCQVHLTEELEGMTISLPSATRNLAVDGYVPKPH